GRAFGRAPQGALRAVNGCRAGARRTADPVPVTTVCQHEGAYHGRRHGPSNGLPRFPQSRSFHMKIRTALLATACAFELSACGGDDASPTADPAATPSTAPAETSPAQTPPATTDAAPGDMAPADTAPADSADAAPQDATASAGGACEVEIEGNDAMQFNTKSITIPSSCDDFTITLVHTGTMPVAAMGHNVVITESGDMQGVNADGMAAGLEQGYVKPDDDRVIAKTELI